MGLLNNSEDSKVANSQVTKPCACMSHAQCALQGHHCNTCWTAIHKANIKKNNLGMLAVICPYCYALYFDYKKLRSSWVNHPKFSMCYLQGQIQLLPL